MMCRKSVIAGVLVFYGLLIGLAATVLVPAFRRWQYERDFSENAVLYSMVIRGAYSKQHGEGSTDPINTERLVRKAAEAEGFTDSAGNALDVQIWRAEGKLHVCINAPGYDEKCSTPDDLHYLAEFPLGSSGERRSSKMGYGRCGKQ